MDDNLTDKQLEAALEKMLKSDKLTKQIKKVVDEETKSDREMEKMIVDITKNVLVQLYKTMWTKKSFWTSSLKNKSN